MDILEEVDQLEALREQVAGESSNQHISSQARRKIFKSPKKVTQKRTQDDAFKVACEFKKKEASSPNSSTSQITQAAEPNDKCSIFGKLVAEKLRNFRKRVSCFAIRGVFRFNKK